jgi:carbonic anhydrase
VDSANIIVVGETLTRIAPFLARNARIALDHRPVPLAPPTSGIVVVSCLDHRLPPESFLGLAVGEAPVLRNAGGRVTPAVIQDVAFLAFLAEQLVGDPGPEALFEVAVIHHTQCGTGFLADASFRRQAAEATGASDDDLVATVVEDPYVTVPHDVRLLLEAPAVPQKISVSGHVYDLATGRLTTVEDARRPLR